MIDMTVGELADVIKWFECGPETVVPTFEGIRKSLNLPQPGPLDVTIDGVSLRALMESDEVSRRESGQGARPKMTPAQRAAVSAHWSTALRSKVAERNECDHNQVRIEVDCE